MGRDRLVKKNKMIRAQNANVLSTTYHQFHLVYAVAIRCEVMNGSDDESQQAVSANV